MPVDPQLRELISRIEAWSAAHPAPSSIEEVRRLTALQQAELLLPVRLPVDSVEERRIPGPAGEIPLRIYRPVSAGKVPAVRVPTVVFFHGGGWTNCDLDSHDPHCRRLCVRASAVVVSVAYRLAPEHRFPAGYDDAVAAFRWAVRHVEELGGDRSRLAVAGDSAGANLATGVALVARDEGLPLAAQLLVYPVTDLSRPYPSLRRFAHGYLVDVDPDGTPPADYLTDPAQVRDPRVSPSLADLQGVAPAVVAIGDHDPLVDSAIAYVEALRAAGVRVSFRLFEGLTHAFMCVDAVPACTHATDLLCDDFVRVLGEQADRPSRAR